jgi:hypothetical protein
MKKKIIVAPIQLQDYQILGLHKNTKDYGLPVRTVEKFYLHLHGTRVLTLTELQV